MNFNNIDKTEIFDAFLEKYRDKIDLNSTISVYNSDCQGGNIVQQLESTKNDSPYICDVENFEIMRSESIWSACNFTQKEEFALIAHELGHLNIKLNDIECNDTQDEECKADDYAVKLGLKSELKSALSKMLTYCSDDWLKTLEISDYESDLKKRITRL